MFVHSATAIMNGRAEKKLQPIPHTSHIAAMTHRRFNQNSCVLFFLFSILAHLVWERGTCRGLGLWSSTLGTHLQIDCAQRNSFDSAVFTQILWVTQLGEPKGQESSAN